MILGEGAAMFVLEPLEAAQARGARIHAELVGFGMSADACHITQPSVDGAARAMRAALRSAKLAPEQIGYINAHGTATLANDLTETAAIRQVFGAHADRLAISSTKSMHGHALGAAAALECLATAIALRDGVLPPTANFNEPDPECDLDVIPNVARRQQVEYALSNSFAFGGLNAVLVLRASIGRLLQIDRDAERDAGQGHIEDGGPGAAARVIQREIAIARLHGPVFLDAVAEQSDQLVFESRSGAPAANVPRQIEDKLLGEGPFRSACRRRDPPGPVSGRNSD